MGRRDHLGLLLERLDSLPQNPLPMFHKVAFPAQPVEVGGVRLPFPMILAAGFVKGQAYSAQ